MWKSSRQTNRCETGARLFLLNVIEKIHDWKNFGYGPIDWAKEDVAGVEANRKKLEALQCRIGEDCVVCHAEVKCGDPATEIARAAEILGADLIILTTRNLADIPMRGEPKPSFAESVVRRARRPVLLLPIVERNEIPHS
ncbi:MAG: universal stress protein [Pedosphaera sp.]|nr:universal stress protein [Pedosphaera sp.]